MRTTVNRLSAKRLLNQALCGLLLTGMASAASAASTSTGLNSRDILQQFNLVVLGKSQTFSGNVAGRTYIGGSVTGGTFGTNLPTTSTSKYAGLTVQGAASGIMVNGQSAVIAGTLSNSTINQGSTAVLGSSRYSNFNGQGSTYIAGAVTGGNINQNRITSLSQNSALQSEVIAAQNTSTSALKTSLNTLSQQLSTQKATGDYTVQNKNKVIFNAKANSSGIAVIDLTGSNSSVLSTFKEFDFNVASNVTTLLFNVDSKSVSIAANFLGNSARSLASKTIWNFYGATTVALNSQFGGMVLAPNATLTNSSEVIGGVYVNSLLQKGNINVASFSGVLPAVPEPETYALLGLGLVMLGWRAKKSRQASLCVAA